MDGTIFNVLRHNVLIFSRSTSNMIGYFGVTLFLSEYCGFNIPKNLDKVKNSYISCIAKMVKMSF